MAECNYDEVTHSIYPPENPDPMYHWDAHFPERLSRLHLSLEFSSPVFRRSRRAKERSTGRYKTQPITFDEITEVDEDPATAQGSAAAQGIPDNRRDLKTTLFRHQIPGFSRSVDGLVVSGGFVRTTSGASTGSDKENTPCDPDRVADLGSTEEDEENRSSTQALNCSTLEGGAIAGLPAEVVRHRRKRSGRRLRNRNAVPEEVPETDKME